MSTCPRTGAVGFHAKCALFHSTCALVPPILRQPYKTASSRVARCGTTRGLAQDRWNFLQDRRTSRGTRAHLAWNSALHRPCIGAFRVESYIPSTSRRYDAPFRYESRHRFALSYLPPSFRVATRYQPSTPSEPLSRHRVYAVRVHEYAGREGGGATVWPCSTLAPQPGHRSPAPPIEGVEGLAPARPAAPPRRLPSETERAKREN